MCEPISLITAGLSVASAVNGAVQQKKAQKEQTRVNNETFAAQTEAAEAQKARNIQQTAFIKEGVVDNYGQNEVARQQATEQSGEKIQANGIEAAKAAATARTAAGEGGYSVDRVLNQIEADKLRYTDSVNSNLQDTLQGFDVNDTNIYRNGKSQVNGLQDPNNVVMGATPAAPDYLGAALKIGGAGVGAYRSGALDTPINYVKSKFSSPSGSVDNTLF